MEEVQKQNPYANHTDVQLIQEALKIAVRVAKHVPIRAFNSTEHPYQVLQEAGYFSRMVDEHRLNILLDKIWALEPTEQDLEPVEPIESIDGQVISAGEFRGLIYNLMAEGRHHVIEFEVPESHEQHGKVGRALISFKSGLDESMGLVSKLGKFLLGL